MSLVGDILTWHLRPWVGGFGGALKTAARDNRLGLKDFTFGTVWARTLQCTTKQASFSKIAITIAIQMAVHAT